MQQKAFVVIGLGYGDEGKGLATDYLCKHAANPLVVRFNGGHQAGHTVVTATGHQHIFSTFGAGTLRGVPTYWSSYCTFAPGVLLPEYHTLPVRPLLLVDHNCPVTTHYDVLFNRAMETTRGENRHGSCGLGFGATLERHQLPELRLFPSDLLYPATCQVKLQRVRKYYQTKIDAETRFSFSLFDHDTADAQFYKQAEEISELHRQGIIQFVHAENVFSVQAPWHSFVFEGAQGILLDMDFGAYPHVTRSNTTSRNALQLLAEYLPEVAVAAEIYYVTRCYQTRHGAGPLPHTFAQVSLTNHEQETNRYNEHQGEFRIGPLDIDSLNYALKCDSSFSQSLPKHLLMTCLDQIKPGDVQYVRNGEDGTTAYPNIPSMLECQFTTQLFSFSSCADDLGVGLA